MSYRVAPQSLTNFVKDYYKRFHKDLLDEGVEYPSDRFIELFTKSCQERWKFLKANDKL